MAKMERFHSLHIDIDNGIYRVNGRDISKSGKALKLEFDDGTWSLVIVEDTIYTSDLEAKE